jgi:hypothetical protein
VAECVPALVAAFGDAFEMEMVSAQPEEIFEDIRKLTGADASDGWYQIRKHLMSKTAPSETLSNNTLPRDQALEIYYYLRLNRSVEELLARLFRQNKVFGGVYGSLGQEAISVGAAYALGTE